MSAPSPVPPHSEEEHSPAGVVTRVLAAAVDVGVVLVALLAINLGIIGVVFIWSPATFTWPDNWLVLTGVFGWFLAVGYLTTSWATIGRSYGESLLGLRVLSANRGLIGWPRAVLRAVLFVVFPIGVLWAAVSQRRRSVQDILVRTIVVYDWNRDGGLRASSIGTAPAGRHQALPEYLPTGNSSGAGDAVRPVAADPASDPR